MINNYNFQEGEVLLIDKPIGWTSFDVIRKLQGASKYRKFGHAGTLDPLATGLLIICSGKKTKTIDGYQGMEKEYIVKFYLGAETKTYDSEFDPENFADTNNLDKKTIQRTIDENFIGKIQQTPPVYSAIKVNGVRAYKKARSGQEVKLKSREVEIKQFKITGFQPDQVVHLKNGDSANLSLVSATINCSKGTYIRSLVHDLGQKLHVGGYIKDLRRTKIGEYSVSDATPLETVINTIEKNRAK